MYSYLIISNDSISHRVKKIKSFWELVKITTYDYLEKIEDNKLFFLF